MRDILLITVVAICSLIALKRPVVGILTFVFLGFLNPHSMAWGIAKNIPLSQLVAGSTILGFFIGPESKKISLQREAIIILALWFLFGFTTIFAQEPQQAIDMFIHISKILLMIFLTIILINSPKRLHLLLYAISLSLGFYGLKGGIFAVISGGELTVWGPENSFLEANNSIGMALSMNIPLLVYLIKKETRRWLRLLMISILILSYPAIICTFSRGAWLGMAIITFLLIMKSKHRFVMTAVLGIIGIGTLIFNPQILPDKVMNRFEDLINYENESSAQSRFWNWECCKRVGLANPLTGAGFDYYSIKIYHEYYPEFLQRFPGKVWSCHSAYLTVFAEHGFIGLLLWASLLVSSILRIRQIRLFTNTREDFRWMADCAEMIKISIYAFLITGIFLDSAYFDMLYYLIATIIIIINLITDSLVDQPFNILAKSYRFNK